MSTEIVKDYYQNHTVALEYDRQRFSGTVGGLFDRLEKRAIQRVLGRALAEQQNPTVLDAPCGTGRITEVLLEQGLTVTGADISREMMEVAAVKCARFGGRVAFRPMDLDSPDLPADCYDLVTCVRLLHHLDSAARAKVLLSLARMSRRFVLVNVSYSSPFYQLRRRVKRLLRQGVSRQSATWPQIVQETGAAGLRVENYRFVWRGLSEDLILLLRKNTSL